MHAVFIPGSRATAVINAEGSILLPFGPYEMGQCREGLLFFGNESKELNLLNNLGERWQIDVVPQAESLVLPHFSEGLAAAGHPGGLSGYVDSKGHWVIPPRFDWAWDFRNGLALVEENGLSQVIDRSGESVRKYHDLSFPKHPHWPKYFHSFLGRTKDGDIPCLLYFLEPNRIFPEFSEVTNASSSGTFGAFDDKRSCWVLVRKEGERIPNVAFRRVNEFSLELAVAQDEKGRWGYVSADGLWIVPPMFTYASEFSETGYSIVRSGRANRVISLGGKTVFSFDAIRSEITPDGVVFGHTEEEMFFYSLRGDVIWHVNLSSFSEGTSQDAKDPHIEGFGNSGNS